MAEVAKGISYRVGDLLEDDARVLVNAVCCRGVMGAGIALAFRRRYPAMFDEYVQVCRGGGLKPGGIHAWGVGDGRWVVNVATKDDWRHPSRPGYILDGVSALKGWCIEHRIDSMAVPMLGCGLGGMEPAVVVPLMVRELGGVVADLRVYAQVPWTERMKGL